MLDDNKCGVTKIEGINGSLCMKESYVSGETIASCFEQVLKHIGINMSMDYEYYKGFGEPKWVFHFKLEE